MKKTVGELELMLKERADFERWAISEHQFDVAVDAYGNYCSTDLQRYWNGWLARSAVKANPTVWYVKGAGAFFLNEEEIPASMRALGLTALTEV